MDLGLSVKWATCNVGADSPEEYGEYFAWGEIQEKKKNSDYTMYNWSTYKWCRGSYDNLTKYNNNRNYGTVDNKTTLALRDDAAYDKWGGDWRMPTYQELKDLKEYCTWSWTVENGVSGYKITSNIEGYTDRSIFLPAAGYRFVNDLNLEGSCGFYWSSSLNTDSSYCAYCLDFGLDDVGRYYEARCGGRSVRPVCP